MFLWHPGAAVKIRGKTVLQERMFASNVELNRIQRLIIRRRVRLGGDVKSGLAACAVRVVYTRTFVQEGREAVMQKSVFTRDLRLNRIKFIRYRVLVGCAAEPRRGDVMSVNGKHFCFVICRAYLACDRCHSRCPFKFFDSGQGSLAAF